MLAKRIIPCLDVKAGRVVKGTRFKMLRDAGDPVAVAPFYDRAGADELVFLDIAASFEQRDILLDVVRRAAENIYIPLTVGGGVRGIKDVRALLNAGADKVSINTAALRFPALIRQAARAFGRQCIVVAIDAKMRRTEVGGQRTGVGGRRTKVGRQGTEWRVYSHGGRRDTGRDVLEWAKRVEGLGAGEILLTSMDRDGTKDGYDLGLIKSVAAAVNIPVIASGGAGRLRDFYDVLTQGQADAALAASLFHYRKLSIRQVKGYLRRRGVVTRDYLSS
ncbi:MAG: imidazole glycerol phosphate synthase subunit HisF [Candidatus Omnitrophota bacterium]